MLAHRSVIAAALLFAASACATDTSPEALAEREQARADEVFANDIRRGDQIDRVCFTRSIDSFGESTRRAVVVREGRDKYLLETFGGCFDLDWAQSLAIDSFTSCLSKGDRLIASDSVFGFDKRDFQQSCRIKAIYEWNEDAKKPDEESSEESDVPIETALVD